MKALPALLLLVAPVASQNPADLVRRGEELYARGSFEEAHRVFLQADAAVAGQGADTEPGLSRWIDFRVADSGWRSAAATSNPDSSRLDAALAELMSLLGTYDDKAEHDELWAEIERSLGDWYWDRRDSRDFGQASSHYTQALDFWAGSRDLERARERYLDTVHTMVQPAWSRGENYFGYSYIAPDVLERAARIAKTDEERGWTRFFLGLAYYRQGGTYEQQELAVRTFNEVLALGRANAWYDDALYHLGLFFEERGKLRYDENGSPTFEPDYAGAVAHYRRLIDEHKKGETRYYDDARERIRRITAPEVALSVDRFFVPGSKLQYRIRWRNVKEVSFALHPVDLTRDVGEGDEPEHYLELLQLDRVAPVDSWTYATGDEGRHVPGEKELVAARDPAAGAYVLVARAGGEVSRALVLVSDALLVAKDAGGKILGWFTDLETGRPIPEARVFLWERYRDENWKMRRVEGVTAADGTVLFERARMSGQSSFFLAAATGVRQAFTLGSGYRPYSNAGQWRVYAFTDRPAYRPADEIHWKAVARTIDEKGYETPAGRKLKYRIVDPRAQVLEEGELAFNAFGAAWGTLATKAEHTLGLYQLELWSGNARVAGTPLFRLEEYKLPEFEVTVELPEDPARPGHTKLFRLGDEVEAEIHADSYFGGAVAGASVEVQLYERPYYHVFGERREYPWLHTESLPHPGWWGGLGQMVVRQTLVADAQGVVTLRFPTQAGSPNDVEYTIEARVVDASRREVVARDTLRVTRQAYFVKVEPAHGLHRPGDRVELRFEAEDANGNPVPAAGELIVTRDTWAEIWVDPKGREVRGAELERERAKGAFPPPGVHGWFLRYNGYEREEVARAPVMLGTDGRATWSFTAEREGYYSAVWTGEDDRGRRVRAETAFWVADERSRDLGYRHGGVEILVDKDTFRAGDTAAVMLSTPSEGRFVLFTIEGDDLHHYEVVEVTGRVKLLRVALGKEHVPNVYLGAVMVEGRMTWWDQEEVVVPPVEQFLDVAVALDKPDYKPGEGGTVTVTVTDHHKKPVRGELSLAVYDASVAAIQGDLAGDPRRVFYGEKKQQVVRTSTTLNHGAFVRLEERAGGVVDDRQAGAESPWEEKGLYAEGSATYEFSRSRALKAGAAAPPAAADSVMALGAVMEQAGVRQELDGMGGGLGVDLPDLSTVAVRTDFRATALWEAAVVLDESGRAVLKVPFPESTTRWRAVARVADQGTRVGIGESSARTRQPLIARLQTPRFLQVGDEVTLSANLTNNTDAPMPVHAVLEVEGVELLGRLQDGELVAPETGALEVAANGQRRVDWIVRVTAPGTAALRLKAASPESSDGMERELAVHEHGIEAFVVHAGKLTGDELRLALDLPAARRAGTTSLAVQLTPSLAVTMLDALPYLVDYPYGCTEQTMSRFLPSAVVASTLRAFGLSEKDALERVFGGIEREHAGVTHPSGPGPIERLDEVVEQGLERLYDFQHGDGGWAWWKTGESDHWMTAYVVWGLTLAQAAGVEVRGDVLERGRRFLELEIVERELDPDLQAWMLFALAERLARDEATSAAAERAFENLWEQRDGLNAYSRALLALATHALGHADQARVLAENLANGVIRDDSPDTSVVQVGGSQSGRDDALRTAHWGEDGVWHRWSEGGIEATAFALRALVAIEPKSELVAPALHWLVQNRRGAQWSNTRDTAIVVLALAEYLKASGELGSDVAYELLVNGTSVAKVELAKEKLLAAPSTFDIDPALLRDGRNEVRVVRTKGGPLYFAARATFFSEEEPIPARGSQIFARREYYRLKPVPTLLKGVIYEKERLEDGASVPSGDRIEVVVTIDAKNHLEYLVFEDLKPAGFEAVEVQSGEWMVARELKASEVERRFAEGGRREETLEPGARARPIWHGAYAPPVDEGYTGRTRGLHQELRDRKVALFIDKLPQGVWEVRYELRAEAPGKFHALPLLGHAMYVPEVRCNSTEVRVDVVDAGSS